MSEFQPMTSFESSVVFGSKVEKSTEMRVKETAEKISRDKILEMGGFTSEAERNLKANEVIENLGFSSYFDMVDAMIDPNRPAVQEKAKESFDVLARSISLVMNYGGNPELQTRLNLGSGNIAEVEPYSWRYVNSGKPDVVLSEKVVEVSITNKDILDRAKRIDRFRRRIDFSNESEKKSWIGILETEAVDVLRMDIDDDKEHELISFKAYLNTEIAVLRGNFRSGDDSVDRSDEKVMNGNVSGSVRPDTERKAKSRSGIDLLKYSELPKTEKEQFEYVEERLRIIENYASGCVKQELPLNELTHPLFTLLTTSGEGVVSQRLLDIIRTRLTLKDVSSAMRANNGNMGEGGRELISTISRVVQMGYDMSPEVMKAFFSDFGDKDLKPGQKGLKTNLKTAEAWDLMEEANFSYQELVNIIFADEGGRSEKLNRMITASGMTLKNLRYCKPLIGTKDTMLEGQVFNYYSDSEGKTVRAAMVRQYMIDTLVQRYGISEERADRSILLAEEMYFASFENCVVDWDFINGDQYAEMVHLQFLRKLDGESNKKGKMTGPSVSLKWIKTLTPGWIRSFSGEKDPSKPISSKKILEALQENKLSKKEQWVPHFISIICGKVWSAKQLICNETTPLPKDLLKVSYWKGVNDYFNKVDSQIGVDGSKDGVTKTAWVAGIFQMIFESWDSEWSPENIRLLKRILTKEIMKEKEVGDNGSGKPFLTERQWHWIEQSLGVRSSTMRLGLGSSIGKFFGSAGK